MAQQPAPSWPPEDGDAYIRRDEFAREVLELIDALATKYPHMDFSDGVASLFAWLDQRVHREPPFFSSERFPTHGAFLAYLRQAAWNVARLAARQREREGQLSELSPGFEPVSSEVSPEVIGMIQDCLDRLPKLHRRAYELWVLEELPANVHTNRHAYVTSVLQVYREELTEDDVARLFADACDRLHRCVHGKRPSKRRPKPRA